MTIAEIDAYLSQYFTDDEYHIVDSTHEDDECIALTVDIDWSLAHGFEGPKKVDYDYRDTGAGHPLSWRLECLGYFEADRRNIRFFYSLDRKWSDAQRRRWETEIQKGRIFELEDCYTATKDIGPAATVDKLIEHDGIEYAKVCVATAVNATSDWDRRISDASRDWARTVEGAASGETLEKLGVYFGSGPIHPSHLEQIAQAMMKR